MNAAELIARTVDLCRRMGRPFPAELRAYASDWARQRYDLGWCWDTVKSALRERRALWQVDVEVHRHYARMQAAKDARDRAAGEPLVTTPSPSREAWWDSGASDDVPSPSSVGDLPEDPDGLSPCPKPRQTYRTPRQPYRKRTDTKAHKVRELLKAQVIRRGPASARKLELIAKGSGLLRQDQEISRCSTFRRVMKELNIESYRVGFGRRGRHLWRQKPAAWTRGLDVHD